MFWNEWEIKLILYILVFRRGRDYLFGEVGGGIRFVFMKIIFKFGVEGVLKVRILIGRDGKGI